ncbi:MAG: zinc-binding dehydrogenase, partial [Methylococcaceae bacterium]|nr:zinc-binding dehydrogenase [Methylococcaceae bacterium]
DDTFKAAIAQQLLQHVWPLFANGLIKPTIHIIFALEEAAAAHALMESSQHVGKILLQVSP